jgi:AGCS family alanine or glycine:cation symporter
MKVEEAWSIGDVFNGMMAFTNLIGLVGLSGVAVLLVKSYLKKLNTRKNKIY